ncbi:MAG: hypothetical protein GTO63_28320 [Anaerolineae bacterium]|nr:hypothetical protein [Anaerolineae bacterium]NIN98642.1 hypothetical protein [Anaerolineae bacterium]NIQ81529.1 hypothetical protein [Anaerolineae bacterium]
MREELEERYASESRQDEKARESLLQLVEELTKAIGPAQPRPEFREWLGDELVTVVRERPELTIDLRTENRRRALLLGASVGLFLPLLGVVAYLLRIRLGSRPQHAGCN